MRDVSVSLCEIYIGIPGLTENPISGIDPSPGITAVTRWLPASLHGVYVISHEIPLSIMATPGANTQPPSATSRCITDRNHSSGLPSASSTRTVTGIGLPHTSGTPVRESMTRADSKTRSSVSVEIASSIVARIVIFPAISDPTVSGISASIASICTVFFFSQFCMMKYPPSAVRSIL